jgi:hypothetical protein
MQKVPLVWFLVWEQKFAIEGDLISVSTHGTALARGAAAAVLEPMRRG